MTERIEEGGRVSRQGLPQRSTILPDYCWGNPWRETLRGTRTKVIRDFEAGTKPWRWWKRKHGLRVVRLKIVGAFNAC